MVNTKKIILNYFKNFKIQAVVKQGVEKDEDLSPGVNCR
jgi:hypothetical protein